RGGPDHDLHRGLLRPVQRGPGTQTAVTGDHGPGQRGRGHSAAHGVRGLGGPVMAAEHDPGRPTPGGHYPPEWFLAAARGSRPRARVARRIGVTGFLDDDNRWFFLLACICGEGEPLRGTGRKIYGSSDYAWRAGAAHILACGEQLTALNYPR